MGIVYEAEQQSPRRAVALKVVRPGLASPAGLRRFEREAELLGRLDHPGIARIHEAGTFDTGHGVQPFFAMERIEGRPLVEHARERGLDVRERVRLLAAVAGAVHHAHQKGVVHRDLKPGNVLVTGAGDPKVLDFGVARSLGDDGATAAGGTLFGQLVGTLPYMSPEQVRGDPREVDTRTDIYALGVLLYELLADRLPLDLAGRPLPEAARVIAEEEPPPLGEIDRRLRGDLETIAGKALAKEKERRYASAAALAEDLERFLSDEPVAARPPSATYQLLKFARRNRALVGGAAAAALLLLAGVVATGLQARRARRAETSWREAAERAGERERAAARAARTARRTSELLQRILIQGSPELAGGAEPTLRGALEEAAQSVLESLGDEPEVEADVRHALGSAWLGLDALDEAERHLVRARELREGRLPEGHPDLVEVWNALAGVALRKGDAGTAEALGRRVLASRRRTGPPTAVAAALNNLAQAFFFRGRIADAETSLREALELYRESAGPGTAQEAITLGTLALVLRARDATKEAEEARRQSLRMLQGTLGRDHPRTITALADLARSLRERGELAEAAARAMEACERARGRLGDDHTLTAECRHELARVRLAAGDAGDARRHLLEVLEVIQKQLGDAHPKVATVLGSIGLAELALGNPTEAEARFREARERAEKALGPDHEDTLGLTHYLGKVLLESGRAQEALPWISRLVDGSRRGRGAADPRFGARLLLLGEALAALGEERAEVVFEEAHRVLLERFGRDAPQTRAAATRLEALRATRRPADR